jgi:hypothetical protein
VWTKQQITTSRMPKHETKVSIASTLLEKVQIFLDECSANPEAFRRNAWDFSRGNRKGSKLTFKYVAAYILSLTQKSMSISLIELHEKLIGEGVSSTASAMTQARYKIKWEFYQTLLDYISTTYLLEYKQVKNFKGFRLEGVDGTNLHLLDTGDIKKEFDVHRNQHGDCDPQARALVRFDLLNKIPLSAQIAPSLTSEQVLVLNDIKQRATSKDTIRVYDRGFYGYELIYEHYIREQPLVMRVSASKTRKIKEFVSSGAKSALLEIAPTDIAAKALGMKCKTLPSIPMRAIRVELPDNKFSILLTSFLDDTILDCADIEEIYCIRWRIETYFSVLKNNLQMENFVGHSAEAIRQEFFATLCNSIFNQAVLADAQPFFEERMEEAKKMKPDMLPQAINVNVSIGLILPQIAAMLYHVGPVEDTIKHLISQIIRHHQPVRPNRSYKRDKKNRHMHGKYKACSNYGRAA